MIKVAAAREFVRGAARFADLLYVLSKGKALLGKGIAHTSVIALDGGKWVDAVNTPWDSTAIAVARLPSEKLVVVGEDGDAIGYVGGKSIREKITPAPVMIRNAKRIDGYVYACGMKRQVYKRFDERNWKAMSAPLPDGNEPVGFEAMDGYSEKEIYAAGWNGEIWEFDGVSWIDRGSQTNLVLNAVCCAPDGLVYLGGQEGILLRGRNNSWEIVDLGDDAIADIWDLCWFNGKLYVAIMSTLFTLDGNSLVDVDFRDAGTPTCYSLTTAEGVLWSIGRDDVASFDGNRWQRYD